MVQETLSFYEGCDPMDRLSKLGAKSLSDAELLYIVLGQGGKTGMDAAEQILNIHPGFDGLVNLAYWDTKDYKDVPYVGEQKAARLAAVGEICKRIWNRQKRTKHMVFSSASVVSAYYQEELRYLDHEVVKVLFLDSRQQLIKEKQMAEGTCDSAAISQRDIFIEALRCSAVGIIAVHNHPSGDPSPSEEDNLFTEKLNEGAELIGMALLDHVIIGDNAYYSFREQNILGD